MGVVNILRNVTKTVKLFPFIYALIYVFNMFSYLFLNEDACILLDSLFYMSVLMILVLLRLSYCLKMCIWHRIQCCLPLLAQIVVFIDNYIYCFSSDVRYINIYLAIAIFLVSFTNAYLMFVRPSVDEWRDSRKLL